MTNSRVRSTPERGRASSRSFVWIWYQICGRSRYDRISRAASHAMTSSCVMARHMSRSLRSLSRNISGPMASQRPESSDRLAAEDVRLRDLLKVLLLDAGVPDVLRVHDDHRPMAALREAAGLVDPDVSLAAGLDDLATQVFHEVLDIGLRRTVVAAG